MKRPTNNISKPTSKLHPRVKAMSKKRSNKQPTSFLDSFTIDLSKTPAGKARAKAEGNRKKKKVQKKLARDMVKSNEKRDINLIISRAEKAQKNPQDNKGLDKSSSKTWKDFKSVAAAQKAGLNYFTGKDGKKKIAITAEQLKKRGMSLREYANSIKGKK